MEDDLTFAVNSSEEFLILLTSGLGSFEEISVYMDLLVYYTFEVYMTLNNVGVSYEIEENKLIQEALHTGRTAYYYTILREGMMDIASLVATFQAYLHPGGVVSLTTTQLKTLLVEFLAINSALEMILEEDDY